MKKKYQKRDLVPILYLFDEKFFRALFGAEETYLNNVKHFQVKNQRKEIAQGNLKIEYT